LIQILKHPLFEVNELYSNLQKLKKYCEKLPLMEIRSHKVLVKIHKTPSTTKETTQTYYFSLIEHLKRILQIPIINSKLYFGPGVYNETCEEFWHRDLWAESPLFGQSKINITKGEFASSDFIRYYTLNHNIKYGWIRSFIIVKGILKVRIQLLLSFNEIPLHLKSQDRFLNANQKLWLLE
ncbi:17797_t:CDS:1, partial [Funneliformis caledonium]